ncbi:threonine-phosphate decarboxylase [bacterium]|nr:threonine-phosphate decarboxylase [bacterium]
MSQVHGGNVWELARRQRLPLEEIIDFSANINPIGISAKAEAAIRDNIDKVVHYPDPDCLELRRAIADHHKIHVKDIIVGNGTAQLIYLLTQVLGPKSVLIPSPTFSEYEIVAVKAGAKVIFPRIREKEEFRLKIDRLIPRLKRDQIVFVCNPNNPTGQLTPKPELLKLVREAERRKATIVLDEVFIDFLLNEEEQTLIREATKYPNLIVLRSFTKLFALPGLRVGYAIAQRKVVKELLLHQEPWSVNHLGQMAAIEAFRDRQHIRRTKKFVNKEGNWMLKQLMEIGNLTPYKSCTNFILCRLKNISSTQLRKALLHKGILIRDCSSFRCLNDRFIRLAVKRRSENLYLIKALKGNC